MAGRRATATMAGEEPQVVEELTLPLEGLPTVEDILQQDDEDVPEFFGDESVMEAEEEEDEEVAPAPMTVEEMDPDEHLWDGGPTAAQIIKWKASVGEVYFTQMNINEFAVWRTINRQEYRQLSKHMETAIQKGKSQSDASFDNEEMIAELCMLWPRMTRADFAGKPAGIPSLLSQQILEASGFTSIDVRQL